MKAIKISNSTLYFYLDDIDYYKVIEHTWTMNNNGALYTWKSTKNISIGQFLLGLSEEFQVDHIDRNRLNNQKENLRYATKSQNQGNREIQKNNTSGRKGVTWDITRNKWKAQINNKGKTIFLGRFDSKEDAAKAYDKAARNYFGDFAFINKLD